MTTEEITLKATVLMGDITELANLQGGGMFHDPKHADLFKRLEISSKGYVETLTDLVEGLNK